MTSAYDPTADDNVSSIHGQLILQLTRPDHKQASVKCKKVVQAKSRERKISTDLPTLDSIDPVPCTEGTRKCVDVIYLAHLPRPTLSRPHRVPRTDSSLGASSRSLGSTAVPLLFRPPPFILDNDTPPADSIQWHSVFVSGAITNARRAIGSIGVRRTEFDGLRLRRWCCWWWGYSVPGPPCDDGWRDDGV